MVCFMTQLLVSVRNVDEAISAVEGGADIIDVKDPDRGSLGSAAPEVILAVAHAVSRIYGAKPPLSLALGELQESAKRLAQECQERKFKGCD